MGIHRTLHIFLAAAALFCVSSCRFISSVIHDEDVVAKVGKHKLYRSELESVIPVGTPSEDSLNLANQYIKAWAAEFIFDDAAAASLSKKDIDVAEQIEQYRRALVKYRYEELYINERLDTAVSAIEVQAYYDDNKERYTLDFPIVKVRFVRLGAESPALAQIKKLIASDDEEDLSELENLASTAAEKYTDFGGKWLDITALADEFGTDYGTLLALMSRSVIQYTDEAGVLNYAYIVDYLRSGTIAPVEYCEPRIKEVIVNARKQELLTSLERDLLDQARRQGNFVIY